MREYRRTAWDFECFPEGFFLRGAYSELSAYDRARAVVRTYRYKNNYIMNNNGARNVALREGRRRAKWVLPWDGNCFVTEGGWRDLVEQIKSQPYLKYFIVPMARVTDNLTLINPDCLPHTTEEPQVAFRCDAENEFDEAFAYGRRPKVELLWRLGVPGPWDKWQDDPWDLPRPRRSKEASQFDRAGWVARLFSGRSDLETQSKQTLKNRGVARAEAIISTINHVEQESLRQFFDPMRLTSYSEDAVVALGKPGANKFETELLERLVKEANEALARGPYSVIDKTTLPPSGDRQDYWHPAPYWWPDENSADGLPYIWRDGVRVPGTQLYELESEKFDRTRLQRLFDDATTLALAWKATGQSKYAKHGADLVRRWFIDPDTRMNPHLRYAQVIRGQNGDEGGGRGIIEMKDMYFFLDAVRLFCRGGMLDGREKTAFSDWLGEYLEWLLNSDQGRRERQAKNNHGTCFDLQVASIAAFLGNSEVLQATARDSQERLLEQFEPDGRQPHELKRTLTAHYVCFNLQSWANCALLAERCGQNLWDISDSGGRGLRKGFEWLSPFIAGTEWRWPQVEPFDVERYWPLYYHYVDHYGLLPSPERITAPPKLSVKPLYFPHDAIKPFWMLERYSAPEKLGKP